MPKNSKADITDDPDILKQFIFHGVELSTKYTKKEIPGTCPFCAREGRFYVNSETGEWNCRVCNAGTESSKANKGGNATTFIRCLYEACKEYTWGKDRTHSTGNAALKQLETLFQGR